MKSLIFMSFLLIQFVVTINAKRESALFRNAVGDFSVGDFKQNPFHYLWVKKLASSMAADEMDCTFSCVGEPKCRSFNMAATPDSKGLYLCQLLASDQYGSKRKFHANATFHHYSPKTFCQQHPCQNKGDCIPDFGRSSYRCDCRQGFVGIHCERRGKTCSEIKSHSPQATSGSYVIDPDGEGGYEPFTVFCDMTDKNEVGVTVISHDSEDRMSVNGIEAMGSYVRNVTYIAKGLTSDPQLAGLLDISIHCEQFIKYECNGSILLSNLHGWWVSRDMVQMMYWGGAPADSHKCACGMTNTCANTARACNCDANDGVWREDSGLLTEKSDLPVMQLRFGDTGGSDEEGYHTLGKLKCYEMA